MQNHLTTRELADLLGSETWRIRRLFEAGDLPEPGHEFFLVDPLDGTREFVSGRQEYAVNIAFVSGGIPKIGLIYAPAFGILYAGANGAAIRAAISKCPSSHNAAIRFAPQLAPSTEFCWTRNSPSRTATQGRTRIATATMAAILGTNTSDCS